MAESFECPDCGKIYPRENRLVGKAVACECGRRFLVPAPQAPASASPPPMAKPATAAPLAKPALAARPVQPARLPGINTPLKSASPPQAKPARWADPIPEAAPADASQEVIPLTDADLVDDGAAPLAATPLGPPPAVAAYPAQLAPSVSPPQPTLPRARYKPPEVKKPKKRKAASNRDASAKMGRWVAMFVFFGALPLAGLLFLLMLISYSKHGWQIPPPRRLGEVHRQQATPRSVQFARVE